MVFFYLICLLCCPVLNPQITGDPDRPWEATLNESLVQSPIALANENEILIFKKKFTWQMISLI